MGMKDVLLQELGGYSALLEMSSNPGLQVVGKRLGELADQITKEQQAPADERRSVASIIDEMRRDGWPAPVNPAPTPETLLVKDMADWWGRNSAKSFTIELHAELSRLAYQAHCIVNL